MNLSLADRFLSLQKKHQSFFGLTQVAPRGGAGHKSLPEIVVITSEQ
jgi:hypothetical protein